MPTPTRLIAAAVLLVSLAIPVGARAASTPTLSLSSTYMIRGGHTTVFGRGLVAGATYQLSTDDGFFGDPSAHVTSATADSTGTFRIPFSLGTAAPYTQTTVGLHATAPDNSVIDTSVTLLPPELGWAGPSLCPGLDAQGDAEGFADGSYTVSAPGTTFTSPIAANHGTLYLQAHLADTFPGGASVTVTSVEHPEFAFQFPWSRRRPAVETTSVSDSYWRSSFRADCFAPGEQVDISTTDRNTLPISPAVAASDGRVSFSINYLATAQPTVRPAVTFVGATSGQSAVARTWRVPGTTLRSGQALTPGGVLVATRPGWLAGQDICNAFTMRTRSDGSTAGVDWYALPTSASQGCRLILRADNGDLVLYNAAGHGIWSTGTQGIGAGSKLIMLGDGVLTLYTSAGHAAWSSARGLIRTPSAIGQNQSLLTSQSLVNGSTRLILRPDGNLVVYRDGVARWSSRTAGRGVVRLLVGRNSALALLTAGGHIVWSTPGIETTQARLDVLTSGDVRETDDAGRVIWSTHTG